MASYWTETGIAKPALCTKEPLFDYFQVSQQPTRVLYLCPEMGIRSFTDRLRKIKLMEYGEKISSVAQ